MKIFIIDDESEVLKLYTLFLKSRDDEIIATSHSTSTTDLIKENSFDLIIADKRMPKVSGKDIIDFVEEEKPAIPILLLTADQNASHDFVDPKSKTIIKPIMMADLIDYVEGIEKVKYTNQFKRSFNDPLERHLN